MRAAEARLRPLRRLGAEGIIDALLESTVYCAYSSLSIGRGVIRTLCPRCRKWSPGDGFCLTCGSPLSSHSFEYPFNSIIKTCDPEDFVSLKDRFRDRPAYRPLHVVAEQIADRESLEISSRIGRRFLWYFLAVAAVTLSVLPWAWGRLAIVLPVTVIVTLTGPFCILRKFKYWAIVSHQVHIIDPACPDDQTEADLCELVRALSRQAGLQRMPAVGWYDSEEVNAFSAGRNQNDALIAFSTALLRQMDGAGVAAVTAHEIAHIANGDMVTMALVQGTVQYIAGIVLVPLQLVGLVFSFWKPAKTAVAFLIGAMRWVVTNILLIPATLVVRAFSRDREFRADRIAANLVNPEAMVHALEVLAADDANLPVGPARQYLAALKISTPPAPCGEVFSTHPSFVRRISALWVGDEPPDTGRLRH